MIRIRSNLSVYSIVLLHQWHFLAPPKFSFLVRFFSTESSTKSLGMLTNAPALRLDETLSDEDDHDNHNAEDDDDCDKNSTQLYLMDDDFFQDVKTVMDIIHEPSSGPHEIKHKLEH
ncbi:unnamed protein product [Vicia faba]|uniref:Uncharacterized protein n=1 Tax=Vicia faba TaxID=3906 RepID=A0AAV1AFU4_VICFA|nr:unnamed protein product [Vicia faba]